MTGTTLPLPPLPSFLTFLLRSWTTEGRVGLMVCMVIVMGFGVWPNFCCFGRNCCPGNTPRPSSGWCCHFAGGTLHAFLTHSPLLPPYSSRIGPLDSASHFASDSGWSLCCRGYDGGKPDWFNCNHGSPHLTGPRLDVFTSNQTLRDLATHLEDHFLCKTKETSTGAGPTRSPHGVLYFSIPACIHLHGRFCIDIGQRRRH